MHTRIQPGYTGGHETTWEARRRRQAIALLRARFRRYFEEGPGSPVWRDRVEGYNVGRAVLLTLDDAAQVVRVPRRRGTSGAGVPGPEPATEEAPAASALARRWGGWMARWSFWDHVAIWLGAVSGLLVVLAPVLTDHDLASLVAVLFQELHPFPGSGD